VTTNASIKIKCEWTMLFIALSFFFHIESVGYFLVAITLIFMNISSLISIVTRNFHKKAIKLKKIIYGFTLHIILASVLIYSGYETVASMIFLSYLIFTIVHADVRRNTDGL